MNTLRIHLPSLGLGALTTLAIAAAAVERSTPSVAATPTQTTASTAPWQLVVSENNGRRYLLQTSTGRLYSHEGERWVLAAAAPE